MGQPPNLFLSACGICLFLFLTEHRGQADPEDQRVSRSWHLLMEGAVHRGIDCQCWYVTKDVDGSLLSLSF